MSKHYSFALVPWSDASTMTRREPQGRSAASLATVASFRSHCPPFRLGPKQHHSTEWVCIVFVKGLHDAVPDSFESRHVAVTYRKTPPPHCLVFLPHRRPSMNHLHVSCSRAHRVASIINTHDRRATKSLVNRSDSAIPRLSSAKKIGIQHPLSSFEVGQPHASALKWDIIISVLFVQSPIYSSFPSSPLGRRSL